MIRKTLRSAVIERSGGHLIETLQSRGVIKTRSGLGITTPVSYSLQLTNSNEILMHFLKELKKEKVSKSLPEKEKQ